MANKIQFEVFAKDKNTKSVFAGIGSAIVKIGAAISGITVAKKLIDTVVNFERLRISLKTVAGSSEAAETAMKWIDDFAKTTPFDIEQVTQAFVRLEALGLEATEESLRSYGNTASAMGKDMMQFIEAVADSVTGEFERLKEFGIKARNEGSTINFAFRGINTQVANTAEEIEKFLRTIGQTEFAGAMQAQADSVVGATSNMKDAFFRLGVAIGDAGFTELVRKAALGVTKMVENVGSQTSVIREVIVSVVTFGLAAVQVFKTISKAVTDALSIEGFANFIGNTIKTMVNLANRILEVFIELAPKLGKVLFVGMREAMSAIIEMVANLGRLIVDKMNEVFLSAETVDFGARLGAQFEESIKNAMSNVKDEVGDIVVDIKDILVDNVGEYISTVGEMFGINLEELRAMAEEMITVLTTVQEDAGAITEDAMAQQATFLETVDALWKEFMDKQGTRTESLAKGTVTLAKNASKQVGKLFADTVFEGGNLFKGLLKIGEQVLRNLLAMLIELGIQRIIFKAISLTANAVQGAAEQARGLAAVYTNTFASIAAIPVIGPALAPGAAAAAVATAAAGSKAAGATGAAFGGALQAGTDFVPSTASFLLHQGERVVTADQNRDLTSFLSGGGGGGGVAIETININIDGSDVQNMTREEWKDLVADNIIGALDDLDREGVVPTFAQKKLGD